ncbi:methionyl-tRNA formyltransferase [Thalassoporum mexicanum PCC 7367]|uniref:methionyl-tRNA formyltransferase n=1 Tax=Thalassoporum mexicanum TaxID=3457544 RepID=UPI00029F8221|nr:methionyl-tRNA formyltransferase [Pseudanabaena sp. PCC 7367]AFY69685.1 methionyl-tRNA formyltransferase [Pseudanabaena sp. PCC 7367]
MAPNSINYLVAGSKPWNRQVFDQVITKLPGNWHFLSDSAELTPAMVSTLAPRYIFFLHWSWLVPSEIVNQYECVCFHMTDVPYGRGGSPLQNLIVRGHQTTKMTALRMTKELDAGPVYFKTELSLAGNAEEIYIRATYLCADMIERLIKEKPQPLSQQGEAVIFKRRQPADSEIPELKNLAAVHDFIRMLDAQGYPKAFIESQGFRYEFSQATIYDGRVVAHVVITPVNS